jgi:hypothetical protein
VTLQIGFRGAARVSTGEGGAIMLGLAASVGCTILNISTLGACLEVSPSTNPSTIPNDFSLFVTSRGTMRSCRVIWRSFQRLGVQFK